MILEAVVTTINPNGQPNISPMGPRVDRAMSQFTLRPFQTSTTYNNLKRTGEGVLNVTDDVLLIAQAAVGKISLQPELIDLPKGRGKIIADACRWYAFEVKELDDTKQRTEIDCQVVESGRIRDFWGFNRAKHAVIEAAILATRIEIIPRDEILTEFNRLSAIVEKTAGEQERSAFEFLENYVQENISNPTN